jgi:poly-gamma-glutamate synthase PgsB/CapB
VRIGALPVIAEVAATVLGGLLALGGWERLQRDRAHAAIPIRVHVNGTRGKSTVTRLIAAALRAHGTRTVAKTTGTAARLILPDGSEVPVRRRSTASIREQLWLLREARRHGATAVVAECMAIDPALQHVSERDMIRATVGVITNARPDHAEEMGPDAHSVAAALANTVPAGGLLVLGPDLPQTVFDEEAARLRTTLVRAERESARNLAAAPLPSWTIDNLAVALAATRGLGIPDSVAWPAMLAAPEDPGAMTRRECTIAGRTITVVDGSAANDAESLALLLADALRDGERLFVFNHRTDRPLRLRQFAEAPLWKTPGVSVLITGDTPDCATRKIVGLALETVRVGFAPLPVLASTLREQLARDTAVTSVVFCGNTRHLDVAATVASVAEGN